MKLDASDDRGINSVREDIKGFAEKSNMFYCGVKLIIVKIVLFDLDGTITDSSEGIVNSIKY
jgi:phosphatidate phosphatase PAH1